MYQEFLETAERAAREAGAGLRRAFREGNLEVEMKEKNDFVSSADRGAEATILEIIGDAFPDHRFLAEESGSRAGSSEFEWIVDPLDGTTNFLEGLPWYAVSIACRRDSEIVVAVIYDPERDDLFSAIRGGGATLNGAKISVSDRDGLDGAFLATGYPFKARATLGVYLEVFRELFMQAKAIRRCGSAALDLAYVAAGTFDGFFEFRLSPWDIAAGALLVEEAGGAVSNLDGKAGYLDSGNVLAGPASVLRPMQTSVALHASEALLEELTPTDRPAYSC